MLNSQNLGIECSFLGIFLHQKKMKQLKFNQLTAIIVVAISFATAWAVRGQFGHEQGAAWAAGIGGLALVLVSGRTDWYQRALSVALASAVGWGMGGMISYGQVVGYGKADNFPNAAYGLLMLFVIGGLFGLIGGGLTGLTLESANNKKVNWARLMTEMVASALITYGLLVMQLELLMTPPRSEAWAFCLGAGLALIWYMARNGFHSSLRVAFFTMIGGGFGFAFGNFLQVTGNILEIKFNMWNVMEYSIGFFGGLALAYSVFTSSWPTNIEKPKLWENRVALVIVFLIIPFIVYNESLSIGKLTERLGNAGIDSGTAFKSSILALLFIGITGLGYIYKAEKDRYNFRRNTVFQFYIVLFSVYVAVSFVATGILGAQIHLNHILYVVNMLVAAVLLFKVGNPFITVDENASTFKPKHWLVFVIVLLVIVLLSLLLVNMHGELAGSHNRFEIIQQQTVRDTIK